MNEDRVASQVYTHLKKLLSVGSLEKVVFLLTQKVAREKSRVRVILAQSPSADLKREVEKKIEKIFGSASTAEYHIEPRILGGFILEGNGRRYDYSLEKRIESLL